MKPLFQNIDGAGFQAKCVLAYLESHKGIQSSWTNKKFCYQAIPMVARCQSGKGFGKAWFF